MSVYLIKIQVMFIHLTMFTDHRVVAMLVQMNGITGTMVFMPPLLYMIQIIYTCINYPFVQEVGALGARSLLV